VKKKKKFKKIKFLLFLIIVLTTYTYTLNLLNKINLNIENDNIYNFLIEGSSSIKNNNMISFIDFKNYFNFKPNALLNNNLVYIENQNTKKEEINKDLVVEIVEKKEPIIYIYNTHQTENYSTDYLTDYTITPTIMIASYMLKENLEDYGIYSYVEEQSVKDILKKNNWNYAKSYKVTRQFLENRKKEITSFKYFIDLHRDSVKKKHTTVEINNISYAKIMILVGMEHDKYKENLEEATKLNNIINNLYPGLSRGIYKKGGKGVNGIYNQDFSKNLFLFEIGGVENNISEVNNTITALARILSEYIKKGDVKY